MYSLSPFFLHTPLGFTIHIDVFSINTAKTSLCLCVIYHVQLYEYKKSEIKVFWTKNEIYIEILLHWNKKKRRKMDRWNQCIFITVNDVSKSVKNFFSSYEVNFITTTYFFLEFFSISATEMPLKGAASPSSWSMLRRHLM